MDYQDQGHASGHVSRRAARLYSAGLIICLLLLNGNVLAQESGGAKEKHSGWKIAEWRFQTSLYTHHWSYNPDHNDKQRLLDIEAMFENRWLAGASFFYNSFDQPSEFVYMGYEWPLFHSRYFYFQLVGGLIHGYKDPYQDKIPLNGLGVAPAILPVLGVRYKWAFSQLLIGGTAAITVTAGFSF